MRLKSASIREAISHYIPSDFFEQWLGMFVGDLSRPLHFGSTRDAIENITEQFNLPEPGVSASTEVVRDYLAQDNPNLARMALNLSDTRQQAYKHPEILVSLALFQGAHTAYLARLKGAIFELNLPSPEKTNAHAVIEGPFQTFETFVIFGTLLPLILLERQALHQESADLSELQLSLTAISSAWDIFIKNRLLRRNFNDGSRMICPANQHLRLAKERQLIEKLCTFVYKYPQTPMDQLLDLAGRASLRAVVSPDYYHWRNRGEALGSNKKARGGQGL